MPSFRFSRVTALFFLSVSVAAVLILPSVARAEEELTVEAQVDKTEVVAGERLLLAVTISGPIQGSPKLEMGRMEGFEVLSTAQSQQIRLKGRQMVQTIVLTYTLAATAPGARVLGPVRVEYQGKVYSTQPIEINVKEGPAPSQRPRLEGGIIL